MLMMHWASAKLRPLLMKCSRNTSFVVSVPIMIRDMDEQGREAMMGRWTSWTPAGGGATPSLGGSAPGYAAAAIDVCV